MLHLLTKGPELTFPVITGPWEFEEVRKTISAHPAPGFVRVTVHHLLICGSDVELFQTGNTYTGYNGPSTPTTWGHEFDGTVVDIGAGVVLHKGAHVVIEPYLPCLRADCRSCSKGWYNTCKSVQCIGFPPNDGAMAGIIDVPVRNCFLVPPGLAGRTAALAELIGIIHHGDALHASTQHGPYAMDDQQWIVIIGFGRVGAADLLYLKKHKGNPVLVVARDPNQHERARLLGADATAHFSREVVSKITNDDIGRIDETTGHPRCATFAYKLVAHSPGYAKTLGFGCYNDAIYVNGRRIQRIRRAGGWFIPVRRSNGEIVSALADLAEHPDHYGQLFGRQLEPSDVKHSRDPVVGHRVGIGPKDYLVLREHAE